MSVIGLSVGFGSAVHLLGGHDDPSYAGRGRLHDPYTKDTPCQHIPGTCSREYDVRLDLPDGSTETVDRLSLYTLVKVKGPVTVDVEWVKDLRLATRVRYRDHWYRAAYPAASDTLDASVVLVLGFVAAYFAGRAVARRRAVPEPGT